MGALSVVIAGGAPKSGHWCDACALLDGLDPETRDEANAMLADGEWKPMAISEAWAEYLGVKIDNRTIDVHRKSRNRG